MEEKLKQITQEINLDNTSMIYEGKDHCCRCGCKGKYYYPKDKKFLKLYNKILNIDIGDLIDIDKEDTFINFSLKDNKAITFYL